MIIESSRFGTVEVAEDSIINFPEGILAFEDEKQFVILTCDQTDPVQWLHSVQNPYIALPIVNPFILKPDYSVEVDDSELDIIKTTSEEDIIVYCITVLPEELSKVTINLVAPVLINYKISVGKQVVMGVVDDKLIRYPAFDMLLNYYREVAKDAGTVPQGE